MAPGQLADLAVLSEDFFAVEEEKIKHIESVLTVVGGKVVYGADELGNLVPPLPVSPDWSPVGFYGGYHSGHGEGAGSHSHRHAQICLPKKRRFWTLGCDCFAF